MTWNAVRRIATWILHCYSDNWLCACTKLVCTASDSLFKKNTLGHNSRHCRRTKLSGRSIAHQPQDLGNLKSAFWISKSLCFKCRTLHEKEQISQSLFPSCSSHEAPQKSLGGSQPCPLYPAFPHHKTEPCTGMDSNTSDLVLSWNQMSLFKYSELFLCLFSMRKVHLPPKNKATLRPIGFKGKASWLL